MVNEQVYWLWYPGDFEIHQGMLQNFTREERGFDWPAYWYMDDCHRNVSFKKTYELTAPTTFKVHAKGQGYVLVNEHKSPFETEITLQPGTTTIEVFVGHPSGLPCVYIDSDVIKTTADWQASNFLETHPVGFSARYTQLLQDPNQVYYQHQQYQPEVVEVVNGGVLYDFKRAINGVVQVRLTDVAAVTLCYGESKTEALDVEMCYYKQEAVTETTPVRKRAFRYLFVPNVKPEQVTITADHEYFAYPERAQFKSDDQLMNRIWQVSETTFKLCSNLFFTDGIKRDRWIWSGDAYQCYLINQYLMFDEDINRRTLLALRGQDDLKQHLNTIVDYSLLWLIGVENHYMMSADRDFVASIYGKMQSMMGLFETQIDQNGFVYGREKDWIFIDWSEFDHQGPLGAEQILLWKAYEAMIICGEAIGVDVSTYRARQATLKTAIMRYFWSDQQHAFIDSYESGREHVTRHANIFAILFDFVDAKTQRQLAETVLLNDAITQITTPYFKFFEADALCKVGFLDQVYGIIRNYWGGMLEHDAVTFWEEYNPADQGAEHYAMYGDPYGKSLCHAWGASPIYLLGRYFMGLQPTKPGYETFELVPQLDHFQQLDCHLPVKDGEVQLKVADGQLTVSANRDGGTIILNGQATQMKQDEVYQFELKTNA